MSPKKPTPLEACAIVHACEACGAEANEWCRQKGGGLARPLHSPRLYLGMRLKSRIELEEEV